MERAQMEQLLLVNSNKVENVITKLLYKTQVLAALVIQNNGNIKEFEQVASIVVDDISIRNVILAPDGIVTHVYPLEENETVLGLNFFADGDGNKEAILARDQKQLVLGGPFNLIQGGQALVGRLPVYIKGKFWGIVSVTLNYPQVLAEAELDQLKTQGCAFEIWRISPDTKERQMIANSNYDYNARAPYVEKPLNILNASWFFRISPIRNWYEYTETWIFILFGCFVSFLVASLGTHNLELSKMRCNLEHLSYLDPLTGILNRRGILEKLEQLIKDHPKPFLLCYVDLNDFKQINDQYGHNVGDRVLNGFAQIVKRNLKQNHFFGRIGGDEFLILFKNESDIKKMERFLFTVAQECQDAVQNKEGKKISILFSTGTASYPQEAVTMDELICVADNKMYMQKKEKSPMP